MNGTLKDQTVLVIGRGGGIARAVTVAARDAGAQVIAAGRDQEALAAVYADEPGISTETVDLTDEASIAALGERLGAVDHVVSTASARARGRLADLDRDAARLSFDTKVIGPLMLAKHPADNLTRVLAHGCLAAIAARRGDGEAAGRHGREAVRAADEAIGLAVRHRLTGLASDDLPEAEAAALDALECARRAQDLLETAAALLYLTSTDSRDGRTANVPTRAGRAAGLIAQFPGPGILAAHLAENRPSAGPPHRNQPPCGRSRRPDGLTDREAEILHLLTNGCSNQEIATKLVVSVRTVERHLQNAYRKIGVHNRAGAVAYMSHTDP